MKVAQHGIRVVIIEIVSNVRPIIHPADNRIYHKVVSCCCRRGTDCKINWSGQSTIARKVCGFVSCCHNLFLWLWWVFIHSGWWTNRRSNTSSTHCLFCVCHIPSSSQAALLNLDVLYSIPLVCWARNVFHARQTSKQQTNSLSHIKLLWHNKTYQQKLYVVV